MQLSPRARVAVIAALVAVVALVGGLLAFAGGSDDEDAATTTTTTTTSTTTTTTTPAAAPTFPLTGLPVDDPAKAARPALVVKIDNAEPKRGQGGRPQAGLNAADVVFEEMVEGSVTRLAAVFHSTDADPVGPVRSARTTDILISSALNRPLFAWSGANAGVAGQVRAAPLVDVGVDAARGAYYRVRDRPAPYNLMSSTPLLRGAVAAEERPPPVLFSYRAADAAPTGGRPAAGVGIVFGTGPGSAPVDFEWDGTGWARSQVGEPHVDAAGARVAPPNVIVHFADYVEVQCCDASGFPIVEAQLVGQGVAWVFTGGMVIDARWSKAAPDQPTTYTDAAGQPIGLTPGRTWVAIANPGTATVR